MIAIPAVIDTSNPGHNCSHPSAKTSFNLLISAAESLLPRLSNIFASIITLSALTLHPIMKRSSSFSTFVYSFRTLSPAAYPNLELTDIKFFMPVYTTASFSSLQHLIYLAASLIKTSCFKSPVSASRPSLLSRSRRISSYSLILSKNEDTSWEISLNVLISVSFQLCLLPKHSKLMQPLLWCFPVKTHCTYDLSPVACILAKNL